MIKPTVGRVVWFHKYFEGHGHKGPMAATVAYVHFDTLVNLMVVDSDGSPHALVNVPLRQEGQDVPKADYCEWMPYQIGQAAKDAPLINTLMANAEIEQPAAIKTAFPKK